MQFLFFFALFVFLHFLSNSWRRRVFNFCTFCFILLLFYYILLFCTNSWRRRVFFVLLYFLYFYIFFGFLSFFEFLYFLYFFYFCTLSFGWTVHMNFHAKSGVCSSKNAWVMSTFVLFVLFLYLLYFCILFGLSIRTSTQNLNSVAQKMSELCSI